MLTDLFFMLRSKSTISFQFTNNPGQHIEKPSSLTIYQCMLYLFPVYHSFTTASATQRRSVVSNHYLTLRTLSKFNSFVDLNLFLDHSDIEHLLVVNLLFIQGLRSLCPRAIIRLPSDQSICSVEELRTIKEQIPRHLLSLVDCVFSFCSALYKEFAIVSMWFVLRVAAR